MAVEKDLLYLPDVKDAETVEFIRSSFERKLGRPVSFKLIEKPDLLGGFVAKIDGVTYDNSVSSRLARMKNHMLDNEH